MLEGVLRLLGMQGSPLLPTGTYPCLQVGTAVPRRQKEIAVEWHTCGLFASQVEGLLLVVRVGGGGCGRVVKPTLKTGWQVFEEAAMAIPSMVVSCMCLVGLCGRPLASSVSEVRAAEDC